MTDYTFTISDTAGTGKIQYQTDTTVNMAATDRIKISRGGDPPTTYALDHAATGNVMPAYMPFSNTTYWDGSSTFGYYTNGFIQFPPGEWKLRMREYDDGDPSTLGGLITIVVPAEPITLTAGHTYILTCGEAKTLTTGLQNISQSGNALSVISLSNYNLIDLGAGTDTNNATVIVVTPDGVYSSGNYT